MSTRNSRRAAAAVLFLVGNASAGTGYESATFHTLGLPSGVSFVQAFHASDDCARIVGYAGMGGVDVGFIRTITGPSAAGSFTLIGSSVEGTNALASRVSPDGSVVVGTDATVILGDVFWRWTEKNGREGISRPPTATQVFPSALSTDGGLIAGTVSTSSGSRGFWGNGNSYSIIPPLPGHGSHQVVDMTTDGSVVVGYSQSGQTRTMSLFTAGGHIPVAPLEGDNYVLPSAISPDGSVVAVRTGVWAVSSRPAVWTSANGFQNLPLNAGWTAGFVDEISADGNILVGYAQASTLTAVMWDRSKGVAHNLNVLLPSLGVDLNGFHLEAATSVSTDGKVIVGYGRTSNFVRESWIVTLVPPVCPGDTNGDGAVNGADLSVLLSQFGSAVTPGAGADLNHDGQVNGADLSVLLSQFGQIC